MRKVFFSYNLFFKISIVKIKKYNVNTTQTLILFKRNTHYCILVVQNMVLDHDVAESHQQRQHLLSNGRKPFQEDDVQVGHITLSNTFYIPKNKEGVLKTPRLDKEILFHYKNLGQPRGFSFFKGQQGAEREVKVFQKFSRKGAYAKMGRHGGDMIQ